MNKFRVQWKRMAALAVVAIAGGTVAGAAVARSLKASRQLDSQRLALAAAKGKEAELASFSDQAVQRIAARYRFANPDQVGSLRRGLLVGWALTDIPGAGTVHTWRAVRDDLPLRDWPRLVAALSKVEGSDGFALRSLVARASRDGAERTLQVELTIEVALPATDKETLR